MDKFRLNDADFSQAMREWLAEFRAEQSAELDDNGRRARAEPPTGDQLRRRIDALGVSYTRMATWLGLSVEGLHKQMRGERPVSAQTALLFDAVEGLLEFTEKAAEVIAGDTSQRAWDKRLDQLVRRFKQRTAFTNISSGWIARRAAARKTAITLGRHEAAEKPADG